MNESKEVAEVKTDPFIDMVERVSANPNIDADKLQRVLDMQMQVLDRNAEQAFAAALNTVQANLPRVARDAANDQTHSMYARLETIDKAITPVLTANGFSWSCTQDDSPREGYIRVRGTLRHVDGHAESGYFVDLPLDDRGIKGSVNKTAVHATGSTFTYGRRYLKCMALDIAVGDDTDGNAPDDYITAEQSEELRALMDQLPAATQAAFLKWALSKPALDGEETVDDLNARYFDDYKKNLQKKVKQIADSQS